MITARQKDALDFIKAYQAEHGGVSPRFDTIREHLGLKSKTSVFRLLDGLQERGFLRRLKGRQQAIEIINKDRFAVFAFDETMKQLVPFTPAEKEIDALKPVSAMRT